MVALGLLAALIAVSVWSALALAWVGRGSRGTAAIARLPAAACALFWAWAFAFQGLALVRAFELWLLVPGWVVLPALVAWARRGSIRSEIVSLAEGLRVEGRALRAELRDHPWIGLALSAVALHLAARIARALIMPSLGWDDFTYHLYRAARWVQDGGVGLEPAPDAWTYYEFFPWGGDLIWSWALVWGVGDALVKWAACGIWAACLLAAYALARRLGQRPLIGLIVASAIALMPSQLSQIQTAYVDNAVLFLTLSATLFVVERHRIAAAPEPAGDPVPGSWTRWSLLLGMSCGLGVLVKTSFLPVAAVAGLFTLGFAAAYRRLAPLAAFVAGAAVALPNLCFNWTLRGSPFYPFRIAGFLPFNRELAEVLARFGADDRWRAMRHALVSLVADPSIDLPFLNLGWSAVILLGVGLVGAMRIWRKPGGAIYLIWCASPAAITALEVADPANGSMLTAWAPVLGRFLAPSLAACMVLAGLVDGRPVRAMLVTAVVAEYFCYAPWKWPHEIAIPAAALVASAAIAAAAARAATRHRGARARFAAIAAALACTIAVARELQAASRYDAYRLFAEKNLDDFHQAPPAAAWPAWRRLDEDGPATIAATAGWDGDAGHRWFRYPLLGSRFQNRVVYLPVTEDGSVVSYADREALRAVANRRAWLARLAEAGAEWVVVTSGSPSIEGDWIRELPSVFAIDDSLAPGRAILARVDRRGLAAQLGERR